jgi:drug/metabolite transporter (DMT)-like permease
LYDNLGGVFFDNQAVHVNEGDVWVDSMHGKNSNGMVLSAFLLIIVFTGFNALAVKTSELELAPFFGAAIRFSVAAIVLFILVLALRLPFPRGRSLVGAVIFGLLASGISRALLYQALEQLPSGFAMVLLALVPLLTLIFACLHRQESFHWKSLVGSSLAVLGIGLIMSDHISLHVPLLPVLAVVAAAACFAEGTVIIKGTPDSHPVTTNAVALTVGSIFLFILSALYKETPSLPTSVGTWSSLGYLTIFGTIATFVLTIYVINHWPASTTSYQFVLFPIISIVIGGWMAHEPVSIIYLVGCALVLFGVFIGGVMKTPQQKWISLGILNRRKDTTTNY